VLELKLSESPDPFFGLRRPENFGRSFGPGFAPKGVAPGLMAQGIETIAIMPRIAEMRFGANGGLLVVSISPTTAAFKAGLRAGDVIESIDGQPVYSGSETMMLPKAPGARSTFNVVRNKQKLTVTIPTSKQ
jgi:S1-C subfamily serine protease